MTLYFCAVVCAIRSQCVLFGLESPRQGETHPSNRWMEDLYDQLWSFHCRSWTDSLLSMYTKHHNLILVRAWKDGSESGCIGCKFLSKQGTRRCVAGGKTLLSVTQAIGAGGETQPASSTHSHSPILAEHLYFSKKYLGFVEYNFIFRYFEFLWMILSIWLKIIGFSDWLKRWKRLLSRMQNSSALKCVPGGFGTMFWFSPACV